MFDASVVRERLDFRPVSLKSVESTSLAAATVRLIDLTLALMALVFVGPLLLVLAGLVWLSDGGRPFFAHRRLGRGGRYFYCLKLRTMFTDADQRLQKILAESAGARAEWDKDHKLRNDPRVTPIGRFLRRTSLDELPQLLNIISGEMSIVGPRPIVEAEIRRYGHYIADYCAAKPGLTGLWQVSGRNDVSYRRRVAMDVVYARDQSLGLYLWIMLMTPKAILSGRGCY